MKIVQILPELQAGGVERGTLEVADRLVRDGHESIVISNGGRLVESLENAGSRHVAMPVHRKAIGSLAQIPALRRFLAEEKPDVIHVRSRLPAWLAFLAWKSMDFRTRPRLVSTVHGFYSVNAYSAIMTRGESVIAVSKNVRDHVLANYPKTRPDKLRVIHRGVDDTLYTPDFRPSPEWLAIWEKAHPTLAGKIPLLLPGRLTRWKGQEEFIRLVARLVALGKPVHGLIAGEPHPKKVAYLEELQGLVTSLGLSEHVTFLGHRTDLKEIMAVSSLVYSLSIQPEAFGRVSLEALALGKPVIGFNHGGVAEQLAEIFPDGLVSPEDMEAAFVATLEILEKGKSPSSIGSFTLREMLDATMEVYRDLLASPRSREN